MKHITKKCKSKKNNKKLKDKGTIKKRRRFRQGGNIKEVQRTIMTRKRSRDLNNDDFFSIPIITRKRRRELNNGVFLIPSKSHNGFSLFQVNFSNEEQFINYLNLSENETVNDCFFQSVYSIGLRDLNLAKLNSENIELNGIEGVDTKDVENYIKETFDLKGSVQGWFRNFEKSNWSQDVTIEVLEEWLQDLNDNCATLLFLQLNDGGHFIIAYKYKNIIYYFDPQNAGRQGRSISTNIKDILFDDELEGFCCFYVEGLTEKMPLVKNDCHIKFYG